MFCACNLVELMSGSVVALVLEIFRLIYCGLGCTTFVHHFGRKHLPNAYSKDGKILWRDKFVVNISVTTHHVRMRPFTQRK